MPYHIKKPSHLNTSVDVYYVGDKRWSDNFNERKQYTNNPTYLTKNDDGSYKYAEPPTLEIQNAIRVFRSVPHVFELRGTKRFKPGDPLIDLLGCMREGRKFPKNVWKAFEKTFAADNEGTLDARHAVPKFRQGFWMSMYWETLSRQIPQRAQRDAKAAGVPLVFLQAIDECNSIDADAARRLLEVPNMHNTGHIHGDTSC